MRSFCVFFALLAATPAHAFFLEPQLKETVGSGRYYATDASVDTGSDLHVRLSLNTYHSNTSSGTVYTGTVRVGYDWANYGAGITGGWSPYTNGYKNRFAGADLWWRWQPEEPGLIRSADTVETAGGSRKNPPRKKGLTSLDLTASIMQTNHTEQNAAPIVKVGTAFIQLPGTATDAGQTDLGLGAAVGFAGAELGVDGSKSVYNKDLSKIGFAAQSAQRLAGLASTIQSFPDLNVTARLGYEGWDLLAPYVSYTYTRYKLSQPNSAAYDLGVYAHPSSAVRLNLVYERFAKAGAADANYYSAGVLLKF